jgi:small subunit ribosomal protein S6
MYVEVFNRGVAPLSYSVQKVNRDGTKDMYGDGIYLLFTFFTKPESIGVLENQLRQDFSVIRHSVLKVEKLREEKKDRKDKKERQKATVI